MSISYSCISQWAEICKTVLIWKKYITVHMTMNMVVISFLLDLQLFMLYLGHFYLIKMKQNWRHPLLFFYNDGTSHKTAATLYHSKRAQLMENNKLGNVIKPPQWCLNNICIEGLLPVSSWWKPFATLHNGHVKFMFLEIKIKN